MDKVILFYRFIVIHMKTMIEYRFAFFLDIFIWTFFYGMEYLGIWIILNKFHSIGDWTFYEVIFLYNINLVSYALSGLFFQQPAIYLSRMVQRGDFDSVLTKPVKPFLLLFFREINHAYFGHVVLCIIIFGICFKNLPIEWSLIQVLWFIVVISGGVLIQTSIMMITGTISFWVIKTSVVTTIIYSFRSFIEYPISIYDKWVQIVLTFVIPYAFVNFYPAQYFLGKRGETLFHPSFMYGTPVLGIFLFTCALVFWNYGIKHYRSTGS